MLSDDTLVRETLDGSSEAFRLLVDRYRGRLYAIAGGMLRRDEEAADAVQEAFLKAYRSLGHYPHVHSGLHASGRCQGAAPLVPTFKSAARAFGLRWQILAAITQVESSFGCDMGPSSAGAIGWTQFMPATWKEWGMDADGDGKASPYNSVDAIYSTARYLRASPSRGMFVKTTVPSSLS